MRDELLNAAINERVLFVMGAKDTGKTTIVKELANELFQRGYSVGIIDVDVGQSDIGPPTTIGLGTVESVLTNLSDAILRHFYFVGSTSPKGHILSVLIGAHKMLDKALALGLQKIIFDTTGLVYGQLGRVLKEHKIAVVNPDVIVCLQANQECEHILRIYDSFEKPIVLRLPPDSQCREKTVAARRNYRETTFRNYFAYAKDVTCSLSKIGIFETPLFSGQPISLQHLQELAETLRHTQNNSQDKEPAICHPERSQGTQPATRIVWGEYLGKELHLVTSRKLEYEEFMKLKQCCPNIAYVKNYTTAEFENMLVGILNTHNDFCALGVLKSIDFLTRQATIHTPAAQQDISGLKFSKYTYTLS
jgi:polynucleotide 5'-hydroxyl-kinase GRC3/NOL9